MPLSQTLPGTQKTDLVTFTIKINGNSLGKQYQVQQMSIQNEINRIPQAKISVYDGDAAARDFGISNEATFIPGAKIEIAIGYHSEETPVFSGIIVKHSLKIRNDRSPLLLLECRDPAVRMTIARRNKYFYDSTDSDAAGTLIDGYGLDHDIEDTTINHAAIVQYDCTDWDFLLSRMEANGKLVTTSNGKITAKSPDLSGDTVLDAVFGATILEFDADLDARNQYEGISGKTWDYSNQDVNSVDAEEPDLEENGNLSSDDLSSVMNISEYDLFIGEDVKEDELQRWADARLQKARLSRCRGRVRTSGFAPLNPGDLINLGGVGDRFNGKVFLSGVRQEVANGGWTTDMQFGVSNELFSQQPELPSPPAASLLPPAQGLQIGIVTDLEDPDDQDRIRVRLPIIGESEDGIWTRIACLDAGDNRGTFFRPEIDDEVIVGFLNNDPRHPVVLGMLNSSAKPAPLKAANENDEKGYVSRSGMKMIFNDSENSLKISTPNGKKLTLSEQDGIIRLEDENSNSIEMNSGGITVQSGGDINLTTNMGNVNIDAQNITLTGKLSCALGVSSSSLNLDPASATLSAPMASLQGSGMASVSGGIVNIG